MSAPDLWLPPGVRRRETSIPETDVELSDGRVLKRAPDNKWGSSWNGPVGLRVLASIDSTPHGDLLHVSVSYPSRNPSWEDIRAVREAFFGPDVDAMMVLPRAEDYVNIHQHCFHIWQTPVGWSIR